MGILDRLRSRKKGNTQDPEPKPKYRLPPSIAKKVEKDLKAGILTEEDVRRLEEEYLRKRKEARLNAYRKKLQAGVEGRRPSVEKVFKVVNRVASNVNPDAIFALDMGYTASGKRKRRKRIRVEDLI